MNILAVDTSSTLASIAVRRNGVLVSEVVLESADGFGHRIFSAIEKCRNEASLRFSEIDCFAAGTGPGSFTGVRVALSAVKGLAEAAGKPVCGVSNLLALSSFGNLDGMGASSRVDASSFRKNAPLHAAVLDARRGAVYAAVYDVYLHPVLPEAVLPWPAFLAQLDPAETYEFFSPLELPLAGTPFADMPVRRTPAALAARIAWCAEQGAAAGLWVDPAVLDANYVRRSDAEMAWSE